MSELPALLQAVADLRGALDDVNALNAEARALDHRLTDIRTEMHAALAALEAARDHLFAVARGTHDPDLITEATTQIARWKDESLFADPDDPATRTH